MCHQSGQSWAWVLQAASRCHTLLQQLSSIQATESRPQIEHRPRWPKANDLLRLQKLSNLSTEPDVGSSCHMPGIYVIPQGSLQSHIAGNMTE